MTTQVQAQMIQVNLKKGSNETACYLALCANVESGYVNLGNAYAEVSKSITAHQWGGYLSALQKKGKYSPCTDEDYKGDWGTIS